MIDKYKGGFSVQGKGQWCEVEWIFSSKHSNENEILFQAYDANLCPLPNFSKWNDESWKQKQIDRALQVTKEFSGDVWLDDVKI
jgi:hypothetical protein